MSAANPVTSDDVPGLTAFALVWRLQLNVHNTRGPVALEAPRKTKRNKRVLSNNARLVSNRRVGRRALGVIEGCLEFCVYPRKEYRNSEDLGTAVQSLGRELAVEVAQELRAKRVQKHGPYNDVLFREGLSQLMAPIVDDNTQQFCFNYEITVVDLDARALQFPAMLGHASIELTGAMCAQLQGHTEKLQCCVALPGTHQGRAPPFLHDLYVPKKAWSLRPVEIYETRQHALSVAHLEHLSDWLSHMSVTEKVFT